VNFSTIYKVIDTVVTVFEPKKDEPRDHETGRSGVSQAPPTFADQVEARLTNVVVAALKEAFDRDHARLELERTRLEDERRRAEEALRLERQRQATEREIGRLRLLAGAGIVGWITSVVLLASRIQQMATPARAVLIAGCALLLASVGAAFTAQTHVGDGQTRDNDAPLKTPAGAAALWLLLAGFALAAGSLLL
jgi:hypothetical protein